MAKLLKYFVPLLFPTLLFAQDSGLYGMLDMGMQRGTLLYNYNKNTNNNNDCDNDDFDTITHRYLGAIHGRLGYQFQNGWRLGLDASLSGAGGYKNRDGDVLVVGMENLPYTFPSGVARTEFSMGLHVGYPIFQKTTDELYLYLTIRDESTSLSFIPISSVSSTTFFQLDLEGRNAIASKFSLGYRAGIFYSHKPYVYIVAFDRDHYLRFENSDSDNAVRADLKSGIWGLHGDIKLIYAASQSFDVFVKYDLMARFVPKSETVQTGVYDVLNNRSLGDVSLYTPKYFSFRSGIYLGIMF
ncbi:MAG: hypothetical protein K2N12_04395 [Helicobacter sp.]|nr:hypothetical protein [Helicobacter sp.]